MNVYDTTTADCVDPGDFIMVDFDPVEVTYVLDEGDSIMIKGYSHMSGDVVIHILPADRVVELWGA